MKKTWPREGTIAHSVLSYLRSCRAPATTQDIETVVKKRVPRSVAKLHVARALRRLMRRNMIYITPIGAPGRWRRGFVTPGSPADAAVPPEAPRYNWLDEEDFEFAVWQFGLDSLAASRPGLFEYVEGLDEKEN